ncbi:hypothetical protein ACJMK2_039753 [Sinanodonta woodiana]|uniref:Uncharacterized protein n=1 Tax=Sinanodonta woodiana TaxID=1069815 RepID=A0ABD3WCY7_SINWO
MRLRKLATWGRNYLQKMSLGSKVLAAIIVSAGGSLLFPGEIGILDTFVLLLVYTVFLMYCVPRLYEKLSLSLCIRAMEVVLLLFAADVIVFRLYVNAKRYFLAQDPHFDSLQHRAYIFIVNLVRFGTIGSCVYRGIKEYIKMRQKKKHYKRKRHNSSRRQ